MTTLKLLRASITGTTALSFETLREMYRRDKLWIIPLAVAGILVALGGVCWFMVGTFRGLVSLGTTMGTPHLVFFYTTLGTWIFVFLTGVPLAVSVFAYSRDMQLLMTLPVTPVQIIGAKILQLALTMLPLSFLFTGIGIYAYAEVAGWTPYLVVAGIGLSLLLPFLPLSLSIIVAVIIQRTVNISRHRTLIEVGGMFLVVALLLVFQVLFARSFMPGEGGTASLVQALAPYRNLMEVLLPVTWTARALFADTWYFLPVAAGIAAFGCALLFVVARRGFDPDALSRTDAVFRARTRGTGSTVTLPRGITATLIRREFSILFSNALFIGEIMGELLVLPLVLGLTALTIPANVWTLLNAMLLKTPFASLIAFFACVLFTSLTTISSTSVSREGKAFALSLLAPVPGRVHARAKLIVHLLLFFPVYVADVLILCAVLRFGAIELVYMIPGGCAFIVFSFIVGLAIDLRRPVLSWTHPMQAVKNNMNALSAIGICSVVIISAGVLVFLAHVLLGIDRMVAGSICAAVFTGIDVLLLARLYGYADRRYGTGGLPQTRGTGSIELSD